MASRAATVLVLLTAMSGVAVGATSDVVLSIGKGPSEDQLTLSWTGGDPVFEIYRSAAAQNVEAPSNEIGETLGREWVDSVTTGPIAYYRVGLLSQQIDHLAFALITPLSTDDNYILTHIYCSTFFGRYL